MKSKWLAAKRKVFYFSDKTVAGECEPGGLRRTATPPETSNSLIVSEKK